MEGEIGREEKNTGKDCLREWRQREDEVCVIQRGRDREKERGVE